MNVEVSQLFASDDLEVLLVIVALQRDPSAKTIMIGVVSYFFAKKKKSFRCFLDKHKS